MTNPDFCVIVSNETYNVFSGKFCGAALANGFIIWVYDLFDLCNYIRCV